MPHLPDGANVLFVVSAMEDPERRPADPLSSESQQSLRAQVQQSMIQG
jgi:hypothetical protein